MKNAKAFRMLVLALVITVLFTGCALGKPNLYVADMSDPTGNSFGRYFEPDFQVIQASPIFLEEPSAAGKGDFLLIRYDTPEQKTEAEPFAEEYAQLGAVVMLFEETASNSPRIKGEVYHLQKSRLVTTTVYSRTGNGRYDDLSTKLRAFAPDHTVTVVVIVAYLFLLLLGGAYLMLRVTKRKSQRFGYLVSFFSIGIGLGLSMVLTFAKNQTLFWHPYETNGFQLFLFQPPFFGDEFTPIGFLASFLFWIYVLVSCGGMLFALLSMIFTESRHLAAKIGRFLILLAPLASVIMVCLSLLTILISTIVMGEYAYSSNYYFLLFPAILSAAVTIASIRNKA